MLRRSTNRLHPSSKSSIQAPRQGGRSEEARAPCRSNEWQSSLASAPLHLLFAEVATTSRRLIRAPLRKRAPLNRHGGIDHPRGLTLSTGCCQLDAIRHASHLIGAP